MGLLIGAMYFVKKFMQHTGAAPDDQSMINIISSKYLGPKNRIVLVEIPDQIIVVGISGQQMTTLACIEDPLTVAKIKAGRKSSPATDLPGSKLVRYMSQFSLSPDRKKDRAEK